MSLLRVIADGMYPMASSWVTSVVPAVLLLLNARIMRQPFRTQVERWEGRWSLLALVAIVICEGVSEIIGPNDLTATILLAVMSAGAIFFTHFQRAVTQTLLLWGTCLVPASYGLLHLSGPAVPLTDAVGVGLWIAGIVFLGWGSIRLVRRSNKRVASSTRV